MKSNVNVIAQPMTSSFDELIFTNRNREYGAYELRKKYHKRLLIGFLFGFFLFGSGIAVPLIQSLFIKYVPAAKGPDVIAVLSDPNLDPPVPPTPPPPPADVAIARFVPPVIVEDAPDDEGLLTNDEQSAITDNGDVGDGIISETNAADPIELDPVETGHWNVEESATFMGGDLNSFRIWVQRNMVYPTDAAEVGIQGRVNILFSVNKKGEVCDVKIHRGLHPSIDQEAIRAINSSPKWAPAKQNGTCVKQNFSMLVVFKLE